MWLSLSNLGSKPACLRTSNMAELALHLDAEGTFLQHINGTSAVADVLAKQKVQFEQAVATSSMSMMDAERVCAALRRIPWPNDGTLNKLLGLVASKTMQGGGLSVSARTKLQDFKMLQHYLTPEM